MNTYNGWKNYETWNINLWLDSGESFREDVVCNEELQDTYALAQHIENFIDELYGQDCKVYGMFTDLLNAALNEVDYYEIAENWLSSWQDEINEARDEEN